MAVAAAPRRPFVLRALKVLTAALVIMCTTACGPGSGQRGGSASPGNTGVATNSSLSPSPSSPAEWTTYYATASRSGVDNTSPPARDVAPAWSDPLSSLVYAQPLVYDHMVIVADESDTVTAFDARSGALLWSRNLGRPVPGSDLPCGNIDPSGITGTPVIDTATSTIWVVAFLLGAPATGTKAQSGTSTSGTAAQSGTSTASTESPNMTSSSLPPPAGLHHVLFSLDAKTGAILSERGADPTGSDPVTEQQRGALAEAGGYVYIPYGGLFGDCGNYHGYVVGMPMSGQAPEVQFETDAANQAGIWYPAGPVVTSGGDLLVATGNGQSPGGGPATTSMDANSVVLLSSELTPLGVFTPADSSELSVADLDLGSTNPVLLPHGSAFIAGKNGKGYLLQLSHLGGPGGQRFVAPVCPSEGQAIGGAVFTGSLIVVSCTNGLVALALNGLSFSTAWTSGSGLAGPPIESGGYLWYVAVDNGTLNEVDPSTGQVADSISIGTTVHFESPAAAGGMLYVVGGERLQAFAI